ncbi:ABC transporter substrate-binding protein [Sinorhizobium meliloti]|uniref:ABC transporter substrate-binding protein n=1 Tax=Rhizobium meliloti TaxID=382 RepID=UPI000EFC5F07|nr:ABC transporter substrate-binding protein [Sinorhizobium meliloti]RMC62466.1 ABC transporter substrate-binding protein [Sinorhizobium meliloti]
MKFSINRRHLLQAGSTAFMMGALNTFHSRAVAQSTAELRVTVYGGDYGKAAIEAFVTPFEAETGIKVFPISDQPDPAAIELMVINNSVSVDVIALGGIDAANLNAKGLLEQIDYSIYKQEELNAIAEQTREPYGVGMSIYSYVMAYNTEKFAAGNPRPSTWSDFWNVDTYPGIRSLVSGQYGSEGAWEEALMADGVAPEAIYPMDINRVFASLDKIKPHIRKWWGTGSEIQQMMHDKSVELMQSYDGRANNLIDKGDPIEINWNQSKWGWDVWAIPKGSPNAEKAQRFIEFATRADRQAAFAQLYPSGPTNVNAFKHMPNKVARKLGSHPDHLAQGIPINLKWYTEVGSDGRSNTERLIQRWNEWILQ